MPSKNKDSGFTLIELSIVLVIIGLIVGGVLVGMDLVNAARVRAQISQIQQYQTAVNTFKLKYGYIPGDIPDPYAQQAGFLARGSDRGQGDGNGVLEGYVSGSGITRCGITNYDHSGRLQEGGETVTFWADLTRAGLIDGSFTAAASPTTDFSSSPITETSSPALKDIFPPAKINESIYVIVWSGGYCLNDGLNYFGISGITDSGSTLTNPSASKRLSVIQAYNIDNKIDDGLPQSGSIFANIMGIFWAGNYDSITRGAVTSSTNPSVSTQSSSTTCYDNGNVANATEQYSVGQNSGNGLNCYLSFKFQ